MNDVDFPVDRVLDGIEAARAVGLPVKVNCVVKRGVNDDQIVPLARYFRETGDTLRFIEFMDVGATNGWRMDDVVPAAEIVAAVDREFPLEPAEAQLPRRGRQALALPRRRAARSASSRRSRSRSAATARGRGSRPRASSTPASSRCAATTCARSSAAARATRSSPSGWRRSGTSAATATRSSAPRRRRRRADGRDELHRRLSRALGTTASALSHRSAGPAPFADVGPKSIRCSRVSSSAGSRAALFAARLGRSGPPARDLVRLRARRTSSRAASPTAIPTKAFANGFRVVHLETNLTHRLYELTFQQFVDQRHWLAQLVSWTYWNSEFTVVGLALLWVYFRRHDVFIRFRNSILLANVIGLLGYVFMPTAPPRLLGARLRRQRTRDGLVQLAANPYAAMPSLHAARLADRRHRARRLVAGTGGRRRSGSSGRRGSGSR